MTIDPQAWVAAGSVAVAAFGFAGVVVAEAQRTRRALKGVGERVAKVDSKVDDAAAAAGEARDAAGQAAQQTVTTGNGHAARVEGALEQVLERMTRMEEASAETRADIRTIRTDLTHHLQDHAGAELHRRAG